MLLRNAVAPTPFSVAHRSYVKSLYRRYLKNSLDWCIRRDVWRDRAIEIRAEFERNRHIQNPRELSRVLQQAEEALSASKHPDPYKRKCIALLRTSILTIALLSTRGRRWNKMVRIVCILDIPILIFFRSSGSEMYRYVCFARTCSDFSPSPL